MDRTIETRWWIVGTLPDDMRATAVGRWFDVVRVSRWSRLEGCNWRSRCRRDVCVGIDGHDDKHVVVEARSNLSCRSRGR